MTDATRDAVVVGAGPNGLAAAIALAQEGIAVTVYEAGEKPGGGSRSKELTLPGFIHDVCSAVHPLGVTSPYLRTLPLAEHGLSWVHPEVPLAHPLDDGTAVLLHRSLDATAAVLGDDGKAYRDLMKPLVDHWPELIAGVLGPLVKPPRHPLLMARFGLKALGSARGLAESTFAGERARALFAGLAAHANLPIESRFSASFGLVLAGSAHAVGWPVARGGSQSIADALTSYLRSLGGDVVTNQPVESLDQLPDARAVLFDLTPRQIASIAGDRLTKTKRKSYERFRYGAGVFKLDFALAGPVPWRAADCARAATVHLGGTLEEIAASESSVARGGVSEKPYVLVTQPSLFDSTRAPVGKQTLWAYCHVPAGSAVDMTDRIEAQIERFAPGFRDLILAKHVMRPADLESYNANYIGGDIAGGALDGLQLLLRPGLSFNPYVAGDGLYVCSSSTPPGAGVHGMCGYHAAQAALHGSFRA